MDITKDYNILICSSKELNGFEFLFDIIQESNQLSILKTPKNNGISNGSLISFCDKYYFQYNMDVIFLYQAPYVCRRA